MPTPAALSLLLFLLSLVPACGNGGDDALREAPEARAERRPATRLDTMLLEGTPEPVTLNLFRTPPDFPLPFDAYVPEDMATETSMEDGGGAAVRFIAAFGGVRNPDAFMQLYVHPEGTDHQEALAAVRAFEAAQGVPVSMGLEPLPEPEAAARMPWADASYVFRSQAGGGRWNVGSIGLGTHDGRVFHLIQRYPAEYGDGFGPRAALIVDTWRWSDGSALRDGPPGQDVTVPSARPDSPAAPPAD